MASSNLNTTYLLQVRKNELNEVVDRLAGLDHHHDLSGLLQLAAELFNGVSTNDRFTLGTISKELVDLGGSTVVSAHGKSVIGHVQDQVLTHNGETDQTDIS
jgi:hypothetical protein